MRVDAFDFQLPADLIALTPAEPRDSARMLEVLPGARTPLADRHVRDLPGLLRPGDALVLNDTRVIPAELFGWRRREGGEAAQISVTLHRRVGASRWRAFARPAKRLRPGDRLQFGTPEDRVFLLGTLEATVGDKHEGGEVSLVFDLSGPDLDRAIADIGVVPLPPYIASRRPANERDRALYQTIYAREEGAVAAPTAGLHFTDALFDSLKARGIARHFVTLHVGAGTFLPVKAADTRDHRMHSEWATLTTETARALNGTRDNGGRVVAVGTTSLRLLESAVDEHGRIMPFSGETDIFITPGYRFGAVDLLMTNFHLPRSTLFMLVCAFSGLETMRRAYAHAITERYRFYSYGDACLLHPSPDPAPASGDKQ